MALCCGDSELADDIAQDTYMKAYLSSDTFREESKFSTWIYRIAYNSFLSSRRSLREKTTLDATIHLESDERPDSTFKYEKLYASLRLLSEKERSVILLHYLEGKQIKEISGITGDSDSAVKQQLSRGRKHLRELVGSPEI